MIINGIDVVGHFIMICKKCDKVIAQCKCMDKNKTKYYSTCESCKKGNSK